MVTGELRADRQQLRNNAVDGLVARGVRNRWYAICPSSFVSSTPVALTRLSEDLVLWRDGDGDVHVLEDRCPHRGAPLSLGQNFGNRIACIYHGVQVDGSGTVVSVPGSPGCALEGKSLTRVFPSKEVAGAVFAWFGDELHPEPTPLVLPEQLTTDEFSWFLCLAEWNASYRFSYENGIDPMHGAFLHRKSHSMQEGSSAAEFHVRNTDTGFVFEKKDQRDVNYDWAEFWDTGVMCLRLEIPYPKSGGPGGNFGVIHFATPIDETRFTGFFYRFRRVQGWQRDVWRFLYKNRLEARHWAVLEQDRAMLEAMAPDADAREHLYRHDLGVTRLRKLLRNTARDQLAELQAAVELA